MATSATEPHIERAIAACNDHDPDRLMDEMAEGAMCTGPLEEHL